jgi:glycerol-3-phosphate dehydrogenase
MDGAAKNGTTELGRRVDQRVDVLVVGGGVTGACIAWEAARRGLTVALIEREDFGAGATANCLKIVHGGLRYLQHLDLRRMRESIAERSAWLRLAPHLVEPLPVLVPTWRGRFPARWLLAGALAANEAISADRNRGLTWDRAIPRARVLSRRESVELLPELDRPGLTGGVLFHDALMYSPERVTLEAVLAARAAGAVVLNHTEVMAAVTRDGRVCGARLRCRLSGQEIEVGTRWIVNAAGAAADAVAARLLGRTVGAVHRYSVALNFVTSQPARPVAFTVTGGAADPDRVLAAGARQLFVVPWRGQTMIGTAHLHFRGDPAEFELGEEHVQAFTSEVAAAVPPLALGTDQVRLVHRGLLPVTDAHGSGAVRLLKRHQVIDHAADGLAGALSVVSVKFTTARVLAREAVARITGDPATADPTQLRLPGADFESLDSLRRDVASHSGAALDGEIVEHLVRSYGARAAGVIDAVPRIMDGAARVVAGAPVIRAQLLYGVTAELARTAEDLVWRRTEIGPRGLADSAAMAAAREAIAAAQAQPAR